MRLDAEEKDEEVSPRFHIECRAPERNDDHEGVYGEGTKGEGEGEGEERVRALSSFERTSLR